ncbi:MAG: hypothetical protein LBB87_04420 [Nitrososphaerota archaeon]|jgi:hypothetical protein|nr:hypothetical protein [Nitrososphaerota archaeon]
MKQVKLWAVVIILMLLIGSIVVISYIMLNKQEKGSQKPFYVGVTYCGDSVQEAKELIDKVKNYTNLFVLQSEPFWWNITILEEIGDYTIASGLNYAVSGGTSTAYVNWWVNDAKERWGEPFIGIYYNDEPGGKMLDAHVTLESTVIHDEFIGGGISVNETIIKHNMGEITVYDEKQTTYFPDGTINVIIYQHDEQGRVLRPSSILIIYQPNGTITVHENIFDQENRNVYTAENITKYQLPIQPYEEILKQNPIQTFDDSAKAFVNATKETLENRFLDKAQLEETILVFTSDYGLYWWDYQSGYDLVLAQLGWNNSIIQEIGLVRGAANLQGKSWGTIITWKYTHAPYLADGEEIFEQMKTSYENGAEYVLIFNYSEDPENPNTLQEEHFQALERFWNEVVQNPKVIHCSIKADAALVLPQNYGWGMRHPEDNIWGIWQADDTSQQIWSQLQGKIDEYGLKLDIIYEDPNYPIEGKYSNIYYWYQE